MEEYISYRISLLEEIEVLEVNPQLSTLSCMCSLTKFTFTRLFRNGQKWWEKSLKASGRF